MNQKAKTVVAEAISKMKNAMFDHMANTELGIHGTCTFTIPVDDLVILEREAIQLERDYERLREALEGERNVKAKLGEKYRSEKEENARLREALGFYANEEKWSEWDEPSEFECLPPAAIEDSGRIARQALEVSE